MENVWEKLEKQFAPEAPKSGNTSSNGSKLDVPAYLNAHGVDGWKEKPGPGGSTLYCLRNCVFDPNHTPNESAIVQRADGGLSYQCFHDSCSNTWAEARKIISGDERLAPWMIGGNGHRQSKAATPHEQAGGEQENTTEKPHFEFIHNASILEGLKPIEWQAQDILPVNSFYYDFGDPESFKTFVALDRLLCIAAGIDYHGHKVKQGTVYYIAGEGWQGLGRRILSWHIEHKTKAKDIPFFLAKNPTQLMDPGAVDDVRRAVDAMAKEYGPPAVLHIDTLARNFGEGDENATKDMNRVIQNMDVAFGNDFCRGITHHTGHTNKDRARGSIALHGAADTAFRVSVTEGQQVLVECRKMKDAKHAPAMLFDLKTVLLLIENQNDQSYVLNLAAEGEDAAAAAKDSFNTNKASTAMKRALEILDSMYADYERNLAAGSRKNEIPRVAVSDWRNACIDKKIYRRSDNFNKGMTSLKERNLIHFDENNLYVYPKSIYLKYFEKKDTQYE